MLKQFYKVINVKNNPSNISPYKKYNTDFNYNFLIQYDGCDCKNTGTNLFIGSDHLG